MIVEPTAQTTGAAASQPTGSLASAAPQTLDYDAFLRLLVEQMKNQDPLEPISETEYIAQLATFSNVEQNIITNERLAAMMTTNALTDAEALIGRTVTTADGLAGRVVSVQIAGDAISATLDGGATIRIGDGLTVS